MVMWTRNVVLWDFRDNYLQANTSLLGEKVHNLLVINLKLTGKWAGIVRKKTTTTFTFSILRENWCWASMNAKSESEVGLCV